MGFLDCINPERLFSNLFDARFNSVNYPVPNFSPDLNFLDLPVSLSTGYLGMSKFNYSVGTKLKLPDFNFGITEYSSPRFDTFTSYKYPIFGNYTGTQTFNQTVGTFNYSYSGNFDTFRRGIPYTYSSRSLTSSSASRKDGDFDIMMDYIFQREGGYNPNDCGQPGNYGVLQSSYDTYRKQRGLPTQSVRLLTKEEARDLYYHNYYVASGADKISDPKLALQVFDTAVNMGVGAAKQLRAASNDDINRFEELRRARYQSIAANNSSKQQYLSAWLRRVSRTHEFAEQHFSA